MGTAKDPTGGDTISRYKKHCVLCKTDFDSDEAFFSNRHCVECLTAGRDSTYTEAQRRMLE